jgi:hypothetical protein
MLDGALAFGNTPLLIGMDSSHLYSWMHFSRLGVLGYYGSLLQYNGSRAWVTALCGCEVECNDVDWDCQMEKHPDLQHALYLQKSIIGGYHERPSWKMTTTVFRSLNSMAFIYQG